jgi:uncharacterized membrane protein YjfL (UPF0719 family)
MPDLNQIFAAYAITFGWAIVGSVSMGLGIIIAIKLFEVCNPKVDEWALIREGNVAMAIVLAAVIIAVAIVISHTVQP